MMHISISRLAPGKQKWRGVVGIKITVPYKLPLLPNRARQTQALEKLILVPLHWWMSFFCFN